MVVGPAVPGSASVIAGCMFSKKHLTANGFFMRMCDMNNGRCIMDINRRYIRRRAGDE